MKKEKSEHKNYIDMEVYLADIKRYRETAETQKMLLDKIIKEDEELKKENANLREGNEKLKKDLAETQKIGESWRKECKQLRKQYQHSMGFSDFGGYDKNE